MKILFVSSNRKGKGLSPFIKAQAESLKELGVEVDFFLISGGGIKAYLKSIPQLRRKRKLYDIYHAHFGFSGIFAFLASGRVPVVVSFLGDDLIGSVSSKGNYTLLGRIYVVLNQFFAKHFFNYSIAKSEKLLAKISDVDNAVVLPNGVDYDMFFPMDREVAIKRLSLDMDVQYILFPSSPSRGVKNFVLLENALAKLNSDVQLLKLENVKHEDVACFYNAASVTVLTSLHEGSPNVIKEAMACNCPIISTKVGDVEWLLGRENGHYLTEFSPDELAERIEEAIGYSINYGRTNGRDRLQNLGLSSDVIANRLINIYKKVL